MNLNFDPYYDDFDASKNFLRILFRPGRAVQARELTQAQSILQNQVSMFADHVFQNNSPVLGSKISLDFNYYYLVFDIVDPGNPLQTVDPANFLGTIITGETTAAQAEVIGYDSQNNLFYIRFRGGAFDVTTPEVITTGGDVPFRATLAGEGKALAASNVNGIMYSDGNFIIVPEQQVIVDPLLTTGSYYIGYDLTEELITSEGDVTLLDPAQGSYNYTAPGADRLKTSLVLKAYDQTATLPDTFITQVVVTNGEVTLDQSGSVNYAYILDMLARRTFDESGNYTIQDFPIRIETNALDTTLLDINLEPGKAYVQGYEYEKDFTETVTTPKARDFLTENTASRYIEYGPYVDIAHKFVTGNKVDDISGFFDVSKKPYVRLKTGVGGTGSFVTSRIFRLVSMNRDNQGELLFYLSNSKGLTNIVSSAKSIVLTDSAGTQLVGASAAWANIEKYVDNSAVVSGTDKGPAIVPVEEDTVALKRVIPNETNFDVIRSYSVGTDATGQAVINAADIYTDFVTYASGGLVVATDSAGAPYYIVGANYVVHNVVGGISSATITGLTANDQLNITLKAHRRNGSGDPLTKTLVSTSTTAIADATGKITLGQEDVISITSATRVDNSEDFTSRAVLDNGQRDYFYQNGAVSGLTPGIQFTINYDYYSHTGAGAFFSADSYPNYETVPSYTTEDGKTNFDLRNCVDFRRKLSDSTATGTDIVDSGGNPFTCDYEYYVSRIDKLFIDSTGKFTVKEGIPSRIPTEPESIDNSMLLYTLAIPPYTFDTKDVVITPTDNRRYTMRDIASLDKRVSDLEYYTSMSLLEKSANELQVVGVDGLTKFKNGIFVDDFKSWNGSDPDQPEYRAVINPEEGVVKVPFIQDHTSLYPVNDDATALTKGVRQHEHTATLDYIEEVFIQQPHASESINVNPYAIFSWVGEVALTPTSDHWVDTVTLPVIQNTIGVPQKARVFDTWGAWRTNWTGSSTVSGPTRFVGRTWNWRGGWNRRGWTTNYARTVTTTTRTSQVRNGVRTQIIPTQRTEVSDKVVSRQRIPYMRARNITFKATHMRPGISLKAFFDGKDVSTYCTGLTTDSAGNARGVFKLPAGMFTSGQKEFRLSDVTGEDVSTATSNYTASGILQTRQKTITTIYGSVVRRTPLSDSRMLTSTSQSVVRTSTFRRQWYDPLAETFLVKTKEGNGIFLSSIDLFFETKDSGLPISVHIVETDNGYPTQNIVPFSQVSLLPSQVNTSTDGSVATTFTFSDPVFLNDSAEYAIVVMTNSVNYKAFKGTLGKVDLISGKGIAKQPYAGVFFTSQNASTWTADQMSDIKFTMRKCKFNIGTGTHQISSEKSVLPVADASAFARGDYVTSGEATGFVTDVDFSGNNLILIRRNATAFTVSAAITNQNGDATTISGAETAFAGKLYAQFVNIRADAMKVNGTKVTSKYGLVGAAPTVAFDPNNDINLKTLTSVEHSAAGAFNVDVVLETTSADVSPVVSLTRTDVITVEHDDVLIIPFTGFVNGTAGETAFQYGELVSGPAVGGGTAQGYVFYSDTTQVYLTAHNKLDFADAGTITGGSTGATATVAHATGTQLRNMGTYITTPVTLANASDDLQVYFDGLVPSGASLDVSYAVANDFIPQYGVVTNNATDTTNETAPIWADPTSIYYKLTSQLLGKDAYIYNLYDIATQPNSSLLKTQAVVSKTQLDRVYFKSIGDSSVFDNAAPANGSNNYLVTTEVIPDTTAINKYVAGTSYTAGTSYVLYAGMLWLANRTGIDLTIPDARGTDWILKPSLMMNNGLIVEEGTFQWKAMKLQNVPAKDAVGIAEYHYIPDEIVSEPFKNFIVKVEMTAASVLVAPEVSNFRAIATVG